MPIIIAPERKLAAYGPTRQRPSVVTMLRLLAIVDNR